MADEKNQLTPEQKYFLSNIRVTDSSSTFILCCPFDKEDTVVAFDRNIRDRKRLSQLDDKGREQLNNLKTQAMEAYNSSLYCVHCGKQAKVDCSAEYVMSYSCDCEGAKEELALRKEMDEAIQKIRDDFYIKQTAILNKGLNLYKTKYEQVKQAREEQLKKMDDNIAAMGEISV